MVGYLRARGVPDPEDVAGEVFLQVARDLRRFREAQDEIAVRRWVFTIARNRAIDAARRARRRPRSSDAGVPDQPAMPPAEPLDPMLVAALLQLTVEQREVIALRFVADLPTRRRCPHDSTVRRRDQSSPAPGLGEPAPVRIRGAASGAVGVMSTDDLEDRLRRLGQAPITPEVEATHRHAIAQVVDRPASSLRLEGRRSGRVRRVLRGQHRPRGRRVVAGARPRRRP